jgi:hypothetical protein
MDIEWVDLLFHEDGYLRETRARLSIFSTFLIARTDFFIRLYRISQPSFAFALNMITSCLRKLGHVLVFGALRMYVYMRIE